MVRWIGIVVCVLGIWVLGAGLEAPRSAGWDGPWVGVAHAQNTQLQRLETKVNDVAELIRRVLYVFVGIGVLFVGLKFVQGDPNAWRYAMGVIIGAAIVFGSGEIVSWLQS